MQREHGKANVNNERTLVSNVSSSTTTATKTQTTRATTPTTTRERIQVTGKIPDDRPRSDRFWMGIDLGATNAKAAVVSDDGKVLSSHKMQLDTTSKEGLMPRNVVKRLVACAEAALESAKMSWSKIAGIGIGSPGGLDIERGVVIGVANLFPGCENVPLCAMISDSVGGVPAYLINDADAAVLAEMWVGVGRPTSSSDPGINNMVFLTLGSGIGAGVVVDGKIVSGKGGTIEGGHHIIVANGRACTCGSRGCLEAYASANSVVRRAKERVAESTSKPSVLSTRDLTCKAVFDAAAAGDELAREIVDDTAMYLAVGCINFFRILDTSVIVLSGGMMSAGRTFVESIRGHIHKMDWSVLPKNDAVMSSRAGAHAGLIGAACAARRNHTPKG